MAIIALAVVHHLLTTDEPAPRTDQTAVKREAPPAPTLRNLSTRLKPGTTLFGTLLSLGVQRPEANQAVAEMGRMLDVRDVKAGDLIDLVTTPAGQIVTADYHADPLNVYFIERHPGFFRSGKRDIRLDTAEVVIQGDVQSTVYDSILAVGEGAQLAASFFEVFAWDFDFSTNTRNGDRFSMLVEKRFKDGEFFDYGGVLGARYENSFNTLTAVYFATPDGRGGYYSPDGRSMRKAFLRSPLRYNHITSGFSDWRFHPILRSGRPHYAIDYAASTGTPVWSVADGRVTYSGWKGPAGKTVIIQHPNHYVTSYSHLSRVASGMRPGSRVRQKQVIGYVGSTGRSTGPHLHYMLKIGNRYVNPQRVKFPPGQPVPERYKTEFKAQAERVLARLQEPDKLKPLALADIAQPANP